MKERIIHNATELFRRHGVKTVTMDDIAKDLGISKRTLYDNFDNKESLITECITLKLNEDEIKIDLNISLLDLLMEYYSSVRTLQRQIESRCFMDIRKYHSSIYSLLETRISNYAKACRDKTHEAIEQGFIRKDMSPIFVYDSIYVHMSKLFLGNGIVGSDVVTKYHIAQSILVFARGISTIKGRAYIEKELKKRTENEIN